MAEDFDEEYEPGFGFRIPNSFALIVAICTVMVFFFLNNFIGPKYVEIFKSLRVDLPLPTRLTIQIINSAAVVSFFLVGTALLLHYLRRRKFLVIFILFMSATCLVEILSIYLPIVKITDALRKQ